MQRAFWIIVTLALTGFAIWLRLHQSFVRPLWLDEAYSAYAASHGWAFLWQVVPRYETHPPFYYSLLRGWSLIFGDGLIALRALGVTAAILTLGAAMAAADALARALRLTGAGRPLLILSALALVAVSPPLVEMARQVRPYPLMILVYAIGTAALLRLGMQRHVGGPAYTTYLAALVLMLWLHNLGPLYAAAMGLAFAALMLRPGLTRRDWGMIVGGHALVALAYAPALLILLDQAPTWVSSTWLSFRPERLPAQLGWLYTTTDAYGQAAAALLALIAVARLVWAGRWRVALALLLLAVLPVALAIGISASIAPVFILRIMTAAALPGLLLLAVGASAFMRWWRIIPLGALGVLLWPMAESALAERRPSEDWYAAVAWLAPQLRPGDAIWAYPNEGALPFDRAMRDRALPQRARPIPGPVPVLNPPPGSWYVSGSRGVPSLDRAHLRSIARGADAPTVWLLRLGPWAYDKGDGLVRELEAAGRVQVARYRQGPIDVVGLRKTQPQPFVSSEVETRALSVKVSRLRSTQTAGE